MLALLCAMAAVVQPTAAHIGGEVVRPVFLTPAPTMLTLDGAFTISWNDPDEDPTGVLNFYMYPNGNVPPAAEPVASMLAGETIGSVPINDTTDALSFDPSTMTPGVYTLYAVTTDPPLCDQVTPLYATLLVPDPDPTATPPMMALWRKPSDPLTTVSGLYPLRLAVKSTTQPTFTLELGRMVNEFGTPDDPCSGRQYFDPVQTLVSGEPAAPDNEGGANLWTGRYVWDDQSTLEPGNYVIRATLSNEAGDTLTLYTPGDIQILEAFVPDAGPEEAPDSAGDAAPVEADAITGGDTGTENPPAGESDGCAGASSGTSGLEWALLALLLLWIPTRRCFA